MHLSPPPTLLMLVGRLYACSMRRKPPLNDSVRLRLSFHRNTGQPSAPGLPQPAPCTWPDVVHAAPPPETKDKRMMG
eukprot:scaffold243085_cov36-Tisochrysis_lutea.AAC.4